MRFKRIAYFAIQERDFNCENTREEEDSTRSRILQISSRYILLLLCALFSLFFVPKRNVISAGIGIVLIEWRATRVMKEDREREESSNAASKRSNKKLRCFPLRGVMRGKVSRDALLSPAKQEVRSPGADTQIITMLALGSRIASSQTRKRRKGKRRDKRHRKVITLFLAMSVQKKKKKERKPRVFPRSRVRAITFR